VDSPTIERGPGGPENLGINAPASRQRIEQAVRFLVNILLDNAAFLRAVVLISGVHPSAPSR
jgi:hypothetical protein